MDPTEPLELANVALGFVALIVFFLGVNILVTRDQMTKDVIYFVTGSGVLLGAYMFGWANLFNILAFAGTLYFGARLSQ